MGAAVNIGDALMRWSDDKLKSNYHRVRMPIRGEDQGSRYSIAYFNQVSALRTLQDLAVHFKRTSFGFEYPMHCPAPSCGVGFVKLDWQSQDLVSAELLCWLPLS